LLLEKLPVLGVKIGLLYIVLILSPKTRFPKLNLQSLTKIFYRIFACNNQPIFLLNLPLKVKISCIEAILLNLSVASITDGKVSTIQQTNHQYFLFLGHILCEILNLEFSQLYIIKEI